MRKTGRLLILLEIVTILSYIIIGVTVLTFLNQGVEPHKSYIGSIVLAVGVTEVVEFLAMRDLVKLKNIPFVVGAVLTVALGIVIMTLHVDLTTACIVWGIGSIALQIIKMVNAGFNLLRQPFLNSFVFILGIGEIIFSIFLIARTIESLPWHLMYYGIALLVKAFLLIIEFMIHRYQKL